jgi:hypothetical protein
MLSAILGWLRTLVSRLVHEEHSVLLTRGPGERPSGPIELHYTRADAGLEDQPQITRSAWRLR